MATNNLTIPLPVFALGRVAYQLSPPLGLDYLQKIKRKRVKPFLPLVAVFAFLSVFVVLGKGLEEGFLTFQSNAQSTSQRCPSCGRSVQTPFPETMNSRLAKKGSAGFDLHDVKVRPHRRCTVLIVKDVLARAWSCSVLRFQTFHRGAVQRPVQGFV